jgi:hypothetical protein
MGNLIAGELSNFYYSSGSADDVGFAFKNGMLQVVEGSAGSIFQEFWPDISRKFLHRDPTHGQDALDDVDYETQKAKRVRN